MRSELPRSTLRPCSCRAFHLYVGASSTCTSEVSMGLPANASVTRATESWPTGADTLTGRMRLAASAKYTAEPPISSCNLPKGPSRVSSAIEPATRSSGTSGTPPSAARRGHHMPRETQLLEEVFRTRIIVHLHPAQPQLIGRMRIRTRGRDLSQLVRQSCCRLVGRCVAPRVVSLDDVDAIGERDDALGQEM